MTEAPENDKPDANTVREEIRQFIALHGLKQTAVAREADMTASVLSSFLAGRYAGDNETVAAKLVAWRDSRTKRDNLPSLLAGPHAFVVTKVTKDIIRGTEHAQALADLVLLIGEPGVGKTATLEHVRRTGSSVWMTTMSTDTAGQVPMLQEVGIALGLSLGGGAAAMRRQIVARLRDTNGLLVIDEAQHLDFKAIEALRGIYDAAKIGMVLCGNENLVTKISRLPQVNSRVGRKIMLKKPAYRDVMSVVSQFGIGGREEKEFIHTISQFPGGLRGVVKTIRLATVKAAGDEAPVDMGHLTAAWDELAVGGIAE